MVQLVQPNLSTTGRVGFCLAFAEDVFATPHLYPTAAVALSQAKFKHYDQNFPDVAVPVWFDQVLNDHVVTYVPGRGFLSSPWKLGTTSAWLSSIAEIERIYHCRFVCWSEDIAGVRVAKEGENMDDLYKALDATNKRVDALEASVNSLYNIVDQMQKNLDALKKQVDGMTGSVDLTKLRIVEAAE